MTAITSQRSSTDSIAPVPPARSVPIARVASARRERLPAIDRLRGFVIVLMALDHVRDYFGSHAVSPTDLAQTTPALFMTRWITHFCAPIFIFLAGLSASLLAERMSKQELRGFLLSRGSWLALLEFTVITFVWSFNFEYRMGLVMQVIWATGISMCVLAALISLPVGWIAALSALLIGGHNLLDGIDPKQFGAWAPGWNILHVQGQTPFGVVLYPLIPWVGVLAGGYAFGSAYKQPALRARACLQLGAALTLLFIALRLLNVYGDPKPWAVQADPLFTLLSFLNVSKYPPSLAYVTMTLGPGLLLLHAFERLSGRGLNLLQTFGRVPLFAYVVHLAILHLLAGLVGYAMGYGTTMLGELFVFFPKSWGFGLAGVYLAWLVVLALVYPLCRWFAAVKARRNEAWLAYL